MSTTDLPREAQTINQHPFATLLGYDGENIRFLIELGKAFDPEAVVRQLTEQGVEKIRVDHEFSKNLIGVRAYVVPVSTITRVYTPTADVDADPVPEPESGPSFGQEASQATETNPEPPSGPEIVIRGVNDETFETLLEFFEGKVRETAIRRS